MGVILDFAIFGLLFYIIIAAAYALLILILLSLYSLISKGNFSLPSCNWEEALKASLLTSALNNLTIAALSAIIISSLLSSSAAIGPPAPFFQLTPFAPFLIALSALIKISLLALLSMLFWFLAALALTAYFIRRKGRQEKMPKHQIRKIEKNQPRAAKSPVPSVQKTAQTQNRFVRKKAR